MSKSLQITLPPMEVKRVDSAPPTAANEVDSERRWLRLVASALGKCGMNQESARISMDVDRGTFSAQLNAAPNRHLSFRKMVHLGPEFWAEMVELILDFHGLASPGFTPQDEEDRRLGKAFRELQQQALRSVQR